MNHSDKARLLAEIRALSFALVETNLYLDSYPEDREALAYFRKLRRELAEKTAAYEAAYGPLTVMGATAEGSWDWVRTPWPWESEV